MIVKITQYITNFTIYDLSIPMIKFILLLITSFFYVTELIAVPTTSIEFSVVIDAKTKKTKTCTVSISDKKFAHIVEGEIKNGIHSGGHDWNYYYEMRLKNETDPSAYYDIEKNGYIVPSERGHSLPTIIEMHLRGEKPLYHTFFPSNVLTPEFVLNAFKCAYLNYYLGKKDSLDYRSNKFFVRYKNINVCGYFAINVSNENFDNISILTMFPDFAWSYAQEYSDDGTLVLGHRYAKLESEIKEGKFLGHHWTLHSTTRDQFSELQTSLKENLYPSRLYTFFAPSRSTGLSTECKNIPLFHDVGVYFDRKIQSSELKIESITDLFFNNPKQPTQQELNDFEAIMKGFFADSVHFHAPQKKKVALARRYTNDKIAINKSLKTTFYAFEISKEDCIGREPAIGIQLNMLPFARALLDNMLLLNLASYKDAQMPPDLPANWKDIAQNFYRRFLYQMIDDQSLVQAIENQGFLLTIRSIQLFLVVKDDVDLKNFAEENEYHHIMASLVDEQDKHFQIIFGPKERALRIGAKITDEKN